MVNDVASTKCGKAGRFPILLRERQMNELRKELDMIEKALEMKEKR